MDRRILDLVNDFSQWKGDTFRLASLISELQKEIDREKIAAFPEAVELI
jgi:hypothetical protein